MPMGSAFALDCALEYNAQEKVKMTRSIFFIHKLKKARQRKLTGYNEKIWCY
jgi:hypothetical protein